MSHRHSRFRWLTCLAFTGYSARASSTAKLAGTANSCGAAALVQKQSRTWCTTAYVHAHQKDAHRSMRYRMREKQAP